MRSQRSDLPPQVALFFRGEMETEGLECGGGLMGINCSDGDDDEERLTN